MNEAIEIATEIIKKARKAKKLTQAKMAAMIAGRLDQSYSRRQYQKLEAGEFPKYKETIIGALEEILDIKISELIYGNKVNEGEADPYTRSPQNDSIFRPGELTYVSAIAQTKYPNRFLDPVFIKKLPYVHLPGVAYQGEQYRVFEVPRDAMMRHHIGDFLICNKIELHSPEQIINFGLYTVVRQADVVMGWLAIKSDEQFVLLNPNTNYNRQILLHLKDIKELWHAERIIHIIEPVIRKFNVEI